MKFYLIDDDANVCNILKIIIQQKKLGEVCGMAGNGMDALEDLKFIQPDIVIIDLLMPVMDGIISGMMMRNMVCRPLAPSTAAASSTSVGRACRPAM